MIFDINFGNKIINYKLHKGKTYILNINIYHDTLIHGENFYINI